jgi:nucleolar GTP-binding protein
MYRIPTILTADELLDKAFKKAASVQVVAKNREKRNRKTATAKVRKAASVISSTLNRYIKAFPSFDNLSDFYYELYDVSLGVDSLKKSLGALDWCRKATQKIAEDASGRIVKERGREDIRKHVKGAYGRISSIVKQISDDLLFLNEAKQVIRKTPQIDLEKPTIVIAGAPNVGKSLLIGKISSAKPKVASYPFTTQGISVGHFEREGITFQIIDTPGLLDRELKLRNDMELKATLALRHLANVIVFILDPSEYCGYTLESQFNILSEIRAAFPDIEVMEVENKSDLIKTGSENMKISSLSGEGVEDLKNLAADLATKKI